MTRYEVTNTRTGHSFGLYEADSPEEAIEACYREAGTTKAEYEAEHGEESGLVAEPRE